MNPAFQLFSSNLIIDLAARAALIETIESNSVFLLINNPEQSRHEKTVQSLKHVGSQTIACNNFQLLNPSERKSLA